MSQAPDARDEAAHAPGPSSAWTECWELRLVDAARQVAVVVAVVLRPAERRVTYLASILGPDRPTVGVHEHDIVAPRTGLELRSSGIWADHVCESPLEHWSVGLEAFGLVFDDPADAVGSGRGTVVPVGFDLEWEDATVGTDVAPGDDGGYTTRGVAHGEVLLGDERWELDGLGARRHRWGAGPRIGAWTTSVDDLGRGPEHLGSAVPSPPRALADDGTGCVVEWCCDGAVDGRPRPFVVASRLLR